MGWACNTQENFSGKSWYENTAWDKWVHIYHNIKMDVDEIGYEGVNRVFLAVERDHL
jgi:hypothetical protein